MAAFFCHFKASIRRFEALPISLLKKGWRKKAYGISLLCSLWGLMQQLFCLPRVYPLSQQPLKYFCKQVLPLLLILSMKQPLHRCRVSPCPSAGYHLAQFFSPLPCSLFFHFHALCSQKFHPSLFVFQRIRKSLFPCCRLRLQAALFPCKLPTVPRDPGQSSLLHLSCEQQAFSFFHPHSALPLLQCCVPHHKQYASPFSQDLA